jgi:structure-specific recognition protein 1
MVVWEDGTGARLRSYVCAPWFDSSTACVLRAHFIASDIVFSVNTKHVFDLPISEVSNSNIAGKNEVAIEFAPPSSFIPDPKNKALRAPDELVEMRFYVPGKSRKKAGSDAGSDAEDETDLDEDGNEISAAEAMHNLILERGNIGDVVGDSIVVFEDVLVLTPRRVIQKDRRVDRWLCRGRFSLEFFAESLRLSGKSTDYRVPFSNIHRIFLLPKVDDLHVQLVLGLDPPIRQGATRYPFLVAQWPKDEEVDAELNLTEWVGAIQIWRPSLTGCLSEDLSKYTDLQRKYEAPTFQVISRVLKSLTGKKVTPPGSFRKWVAHEYSACRCWYTPVLRAWWVSRSM